MKYLVILGDGMPDYPLEELGGKTPLQYARTPHLDMLARMGEMGLVKTIPEELPAGSDVANLSVLGYDPLRYYSGRSPIEAVAMGVELGKADVAFRCNLVTLSEDEPYAKKKMLDYSSDEISTPEAREIMEEVSRRLGSETFHFYTGISYRHLLVWRGGPEDFDLTPPHDIAEREIGPFLPRGEKSFVLLDLMQKSNSFLPGLPVNLQRKARGLKAANSIWLWGQGKKPSLISFQEKFGLKGSVISAVNLIKGLGLLAGLEVVEVPGATGNITTNFRGKALKALEELCSGKDFVYVHIEAPDEAGHRGELETKIKAIEEIDEKVIGEVLKGLKSFPEFKLLVLSDHPTPLSLKTHTREPVPFCLYQGGSTPRYQKGEFSEKFASQGKIIFHQGYRLMDYFIRGEQ